MNYYKFDLNPTILHLGSLEIRWYGLMYVIGIVIAYLLLKKYFIPRAKLRMNIKDLDDLFTYIFVGMLIGARTFYILFYNLKFYLDNPAEIIAFWHGGLSFHGAVVGIILACLLFCKKKGMSPLNLGDHLVLCGSIGIFFGRIGNFINGELYGKVTEVPWGIIFKDEAGPLPRHPSQLYESFFEGLILSIILFFILKLQKKDGLALFSFFLFYSIFRFFLEFFREPDNQLGTLIFNLSMGQILSIVTIIGTIVIYKLTYRTKKS